MQCEVGSYTGNGVNATPIIVGWQPDLVLVKAQGLAQFLVFRSSAMIGDQCMDLAAAGPLWGNGIESFDPGGFTIGDDVRVNQAAQPYHWQAWRDIGREDFAVGMYGGNGADDRDVVAGLPFEPAVVVVKRVGGSVGVWKPSSLAGDATLYFHNLALAADRIQALNADGFQVGADAEVNGAANTYYWFAFGLAPGMTNVGTYIGDGEIDRSIPGSGFPPGTAWVKGEGATWGRHRPSTLEAPSVLSLHFGAIGATGNNITALEADGFQVGAMADVNSGAVDYYWAAFSEGTSTAVPVFDALLERVVGHEHRGSGDAVFDSLLGKYVMHPAVLTAPTHDMALGEMVLHTHV